MNEALRELLDSWQSSEYDTLITNLATQNRGEDLAVAGVMPIQALAGFDQSTNVFATTANFASTIYVQPPHLTPIEPTTVTLGGTIMNVQFHERDLIELVPATPDILAIKCNFGTKLFPGYNPVPRKKNVRNPLRKKQGNGTAMCSQISFHCRKPQWPRDGPFPPDTPVYKVKVFRNGYTQVPGARPDTVTEIITIVDWVVAALNAALHPMEANVERLARGVNLNPLMYNFKAQLVIPAGRYFSRQALLDAVTTAPYRGEYPPMSTSQYSQKEPKVSFRFLTIVEGGVMKDPLFSFYDGGCFNIQGAGDTAECSRVCTFLCRVIDDNHFRIFLEPASPLDFIEDNIK